MSRLDSGLAGELMVETAAMLDRASLRVGASC
jgi:hypothetical protein